jgi:hypothetical protein
MSVGSPTSSGFREPSLPSVVINDPTKLPVCGEGVELRAEAVDLDTHEAHSWRHVTSDFAHWVKLRTTSRPVFEHAETGDRFSPEPNHRFSRKYSHDRYGRILRGERELLVRYDDLHTALITLTAPVRGSDGPHLPIDRHRAIMDAYAPVRRKLNYELEEKRGLEYEYIAINGPTRDGQALGHDHIHIALYVDGVISNSTLRPIVDKHVEKCRIATTEEHPPEQAVQVRDIDVSELKQFGADTDLGGPVTPLGRYVSGHLPAVGANADVRDKPAQFHRHGAMMWANSSTSFRPSEIFRENDTESSGEWKHVGVQTADGETHENTSGPTQPDTIVTTEPFERHELESGTLENEPIV